MNLTHAGRTAPAAPGSTGSTGITVALQAARQYIRQAITYIPMNKTKQYGLAFICGAALLAANSLPAADAKEYQVTGPVLEITPTTITVQKGNDRWELGRSANTKIKGDLKVGSRVTIYYTMVATQVEVKEGKAKGEGSKDASKDTKKDSQK
jgi:hypothetical protein